MRNLRDVVGMEQGGAHQRCIHSEASPFVHSHLHIWKGTVPGFRILAVEPAEGNVGERFAHAVSAPYSIGEVTHFVLQRFVYGASTHNQVAYVHQPSTLICLLEGSLYLHGHHCAEVHLLGQVFCGHRMRGGRNAAEPEPPFQCPHYHHLTCYIVGR